MKIQSNYHKRNIEYDEEGRAFVRYCGERYYLDEFFMNYLGSSIPSFWHAILTETFFSGVLIHLCTDEESNYDMNDQAIVASYYS